MRGKTSAALLFCIIFMIGATAPVLAERPHQRNGFFIGFGVGGGSAQWEDGADRAGGGVGKFRIGYAVAPNWTVGLESSGWLKREDAGIVGELTLLYNVSTFGVTYFPGNRGAFLKGGIGFATASFEDIGYVQGPGSGKFEIGQSGYGFLGAIGYEWRLTEKFAIGPEVEIVYLSVGDPFKDANYLSAAFMMDWYW
jgi:hypothetical protein